MMTVERQLPRNSRIIRLVSAGGDGAFARHAADRRLDEDRLVVEQVDLEESAAAGSLIRGSMSLTPCTTSRVEALPFFKTVDSTARPLSTCTTLVWGAVPSRTWPTSRI